MGKILGGAREMMGAKIITLTLLKIYLSIIEFLFFLKGLEILRITSEGRPTKNEHFHTHSVSQIKGLIFCLPWGNQYVNQTKCFLEHIFSVSVLFLQACRALNWCRSHCEPYEEQLSILWPEVLSKYTHWLLIHLKVKCNSFLLIYAFILLLKINQPGIIWPSTPCAR